MEEEERCERRNRTGMEVFGVFGVRYVMFYFEYVGGEEEGVVRYPIEQTYELINL